MLPSLLSDGRHFLCFGGGYTQKNAAAFLASLPDKPGTVKSGGQKFFLDTPVAAVFAPSPDAASGHVLFLRDNTLLAQRFDLDGLTLEGIAVPIAEGVGRSLAHGLFSVSNNGVLAYRSGSGGDARLAWFDRTGKQTGSVGPPTDYRAVALSPDGTRIATAHVEDRNPDVWLFDVRRSTSTRLTSDPAADNAPIWSRDGTRIAFFSGSGTSRSLLMTLAGGDAKPEIVVPATAGLFPWDWSGDGRLLLYEAADLKTSKRHLWTVPVDGERKPAQITQTEFNETQAQFSPDGRWISYQSDESGRSEIYVRPFPAVPGQGGKVKVSEGGGTFARWRKDGKELFYIASDTKLTAVEVSTAPNFKAGAPQPVFQTRLRIGAGPFQWDVSADGKRFLMATLAMEKSDAITIVTNWQTMLKK